MRSLVILLTVLCGFFCTPSLESFEGDFEELFQLDPFISNYFEGIEEKANEFAYRAGFELEEAAVMDALMQAYEEKLLPELKIQVRRKYRQSFSPDEMQALVDHLSSLEKNEQLSVKSLEKAFMKATQRFFSIKELMETLVRVLEGDKAALNPETSDFYSLAEGDFELVAHTPMKGFVDVCLKDLLKTFPEFISSQLIALEIIPSNQQEQVKKIIGQILKNAYSQSQFSEKVTAHYYRENYSEEDLEKIADFYSTSQGKKIGASLGDFYLKLRIGMISEKSLKSWIRNANNILMKNQVRVDIRSVIEEIHPGLIVVKPGNPEEDLFIF